MHVLYLHICGTGYGSKWINGSYWERIWKRSVRHGSLFDNDDNDDDDNDGDLFFWVNSPSSMASVVDFPI